MGTLDVQIDWTYRKIEYPELHKFNIKFCALYVQICKKIQYPKLRKFEGKLCTLDV